MPNLGADTLVPTELVVTMQDFEATVGEITPTALRELVIEIPTTKWSDVGGLDDAKRALVETILWPIKHRALFDRYHAAPPRGVVLHGPPGTGKTLLARALASEAQINFIGIRGPELLSKYVGESERGIREIFERARQAAPAIIFLDELDALVPLRGRTHGNDVTDRVVAQFLTEIDGMRLLRDVWLLGATNRLDLIDPALLRPGRFEVKLAIGLPDHASRKSILQVHTKSKPLAEDLDLDELATRAEGLSGADLGMLCNRATLAVIRRHIAAGGDDAAMAPVGMADFTRALEEIATERAPVGLAFAAPGFP
jgi:transitional endoplasmic reticulum ATPase